jgi:hypothetical protein
MNCEELIATLSKGSGAPLLRKHRSGLILPATQHELRMATLGAVSPVSKDHPTHDDLMAYIRSQLEKNAQLSAEIGRQVEEMGHSMFVQQRNGSGFLMADTLREFLLEYQQRRASHGMHSMPLSFNVLEAFTVFNQSYFNFDLRKECQHLLSADEYFAWYADEKTSLSIKVLKEILAPGVIYSYDVTNDHSSGYRLPLDGSSIVLAGISMVRHKGELSCILVAGECPPRPANSDIPNEKLQSTTPGKTGLQSHPSFTVNDRYLDGYPEHGRLVLLTRIDLESGTYDVRYLCADVGARFLVSTDDYDLGLAPADESRFRKQSSEEFTRYYPLFSALSTLAFAPVAYLSLQNRVVMRSFKTRLHSEAKIKSVKAAVKYLDGRNCLLERQVSCLRIGESNRSRELMIESPSLSFQIEGYWKDLPAGTPGEDADGNAVVGRTWVSRVDNWFQQNPHEFVLFTASKEHPIGPDPGTVYIVRSPAHAAGVYKVGLTRKSATERATELNTTGVPLPHEVLATWEVGDCSRVEAIAHDQLDRYRINPRREYFAAPLDKIIEVIQRLVCPHGQ